MNNLKWSLPTGVRALIFDCDGTLADTMPIHFRAWTVMLERYGINFPESRFYALGGIPTAKIIQVLVSEAGLTGCDIESMVHEKEDLFLDFLHDVRPIEPVYQIAQAYRGQLPLAVASGGYRRVILQTLEHIQATSWFNAIVCAEDTEKHKPEPDVFLEASQRLGVEPAMCVVFEDTDIGLEAARRANMLGVDVRPWLNRKA